MIEQQQNQYADDKYAASAAYQTPMFNYGSSIITLTDPTGALSTFELFLKSLRPNSEGGFDKLGPALMNEKGINSVMSTIQSVVHQMNALSNFDELDLAFMIETLKEDLISDIMLNREDYELDRKNRDLIVGNALRFSYGFAKRAFNEGDKRFWKGSTTEIMHRNDSGNVRNSRSAINPIRWIAGK